MCIPQEFQSPLYSSGQAFCQRWWCRQQSTCGTRTATHCLPAGLEQPPLPYLWRWLKSWSKHTHWAESASTGSWEEWPIPSFCCNSLSHYFQGLMSSGCTWGNNLVMLLVDVTLPWATPVQAPPQDKGRNLSESYCGKQPQLEDKALRTAETQLCITKHITQALLSCMCVAVYPIFP